MASLVPDLQDIYRDVHDIKRELLNTQTSCVFLKPDGSTDPWEVILELTSGWYLDYSNFKQMPVLYVSSLETDFLENLTESTHIALDSDIYEISKSDIAPPNGATPYFRIYLERQHGTSYTP